MITSGSEMQILVATVRRQSFPDSRGCELRESLGHLVWFHAASLKWLRRRCSIVLRLISFLMSRMFWPRPK